MIISYDAAQTIICRTNYQLTDPVLISRTVIAKAQNMLTHEKMQLLYVTLNHGLEMPISLFIGQLELSFT